MICAVRYSVYAHRVLINDFNRVGSTFRQTWLCKNLLCFNMTVAKKEEKEKSGNTYTYHFDVSESPCMIFTDGQVF